MTIRPIEAGDIPRVREIFSEQGINYEQPDWMKMIGGVLEDDNGVVRIALLNRPTVETYAVVDKSNWASPGMKATQFERLDHAVIEQLKALGYTDQHSWVPPICKAFKRRLMRFFGWTESAGPENWTGLVRYI